MFKLLKTSNNLNKCYQYCYNNKYKIHISTVYSTTAKRSKLHKPNNILHNHCSVTPKVLDKLCDVHEGDKNKIGIPELLVNKCPSQIQPYLKIIRLHRPIGAWLLFWPCGWSISLAAPAGTFPDLYFLTLFGLGSIIMRGAGCIINDMWDRDVDRKVVRTVDRPLASGEITMKQAFIFLASQLSIGLIILLQLNWYSVLLGASSLGLVVTYPLMKRVTYWPQLMLGFTFNWGILLGYSAVQGACDWSICVPMYLSGIFWTLIYDTIYAYQDRADDLQVGIKSTALRFGESSKYWLSSFGTGMISMLTTAGIMAEQTWPYYTAVAAAATHLTWQISSLNTNSPKDCASKFVSNHYLGTLLFLGIVLGNLLKDSSKVKDKNKLLSSNI